MVGCWDVGSPLLLLLLLLPTMTTTTTDAGWGILVCGDELPDRKEPFRWNVVGVAAAGDVAVVALAADVAAAGGGWNLGFDCYCVEVIAVVASAADAGSDAAAAVVPAAD